jgi:hypothetical protein
MHSVVVSFMFDAAIMTSPSGCRDSIVLRIQIAISTELAAFEFCSGEGLRV